MVTTKLIAEMKGKEMNKNTQKRIFIIIFITSLIKYVFLSYIVLKTKIMTKTICNKYFHKRCKYLEMDSNSLFPLTFLCDHLELYYNKDQTW